MTKIKMKHAATVEEIFRDFLTSRKIKGLSEKTLETYAFHLKAASKHLDIQTDIADLAKAIKKSYSFTETTALAFSSMIKLIDLYRCSGSFNIVNIMIRTLLYKDIIESLTV